MVDHQDDDRFPSAGALPGTEAPELSRLAGLVVRDLPVNGLLVRIGTATEALLPRLAVALAAEPRAARGLADLAYAVTADPAGGADGWQVRQGDEVVFTGDLDAVLGWLERTIMIKALERLGRWWRLYCGAVTAPGGAVLLPAPTGVGKSTLVAALVQAGFGYLSDECALLDDTGRVHPFRTAICLREGGQALRPWPGRRERAMRLGEPVQYLDVRPGRVVAPAGHPLTAVVFIRRDESAEPSLVRCGKADALLALVEQTSASQRMGFTLIERIVELLDTVPVYTLTVTSDVPRCVAVLAAELAARTVAAPSPAG